MQIILSTEEYEKLEQAEVTLCKISELLSSHVRYYSEAYDLLSFSNPIEYAKPLDRSTVLELLRLAGVKVRLANIDLVDFLFKESFEESEDDE